MIVLFLGISISLVVAEIITTITKVMLDKFLVYYILLGLEILLAHICLIYQNSRKRHFMGTSINAFFDRNLVCFYLKISQ